MLIEDTSEIAVDEAHKSLVRFESRETQLKMGAQDSAAAVMIDDLLRTGISAQWGPFTRIPRPRLSAAWRTAC